MAGRKRDEVRWDNPRSCSFDRGPQFWDEDAEGFFLDPLWTLWTGGRVAICKCMTMDGSGNYVVFDPALIIKGSTQTVYEDESNKYPILFQK